MAFSSRPLTVGIFAATKTDVDLACLGRTAHPMFEYRVIRGMAYEPCDIAVYFGSEKQAQSVRQKLRRDIRQNHAGPTLRSEIGFLGRKNIRRRLDPLALILRRNRRIADFSHTFYRFGIGGIFPDTGEFLIDGAPSDRWNALSATLGVKLSPYRTGGRHILLIGQTPGDASLDGIDMNAWLVETATEIRRRTTRPIVFRAHPGIRSQAYEEIARRLERIEGVTAAPHTANARPGDLARAHAVVCYSSSFCLDALIAGVPVVALSKRSIVHAYCSRTLDDIEAPRLADRDRIFSEVAYAQWSAEEMGSGAVMKRYGPRLAELCHLAAATA